MVASMNGRALLTELTAALGPVSVCPELEAAELLRHFCGLDRRAILLGAEGDPEPVRRALSRRLEGEPLQYILGEWDFYGRAYRVGPGVLIPRPETELLIEQALAFGAGKPIRAADLCAGSGCLGITLALELPGSRVTVLEKSGEALSYLRKNAALHHAELDIRQDDVLSPAQDYPQYQLILSNPPYIPDGEPLQREVLREPEMALRGGPDGLEFYRGIAERWTEHLEPDGMLALEIGKGQEEAVRKILENNRLKNICFYQDLCGIIRVITARRGCAGKG